MHSKSWTFPEPLPIAIRPVDSETAHNGISSPSAVQFEYFHYTIELLKGP